MQGIFGLGVRMKGSIRWVAGIPALLLATGLLAWGCGSSAKPSGADTVSQGDLDAVDDVRDKEVRDGDTFGDLRQDLAGPDASPCPDDGNPCTVATLEAGCVPIPVPGCCRQDDDCDDGKVATEDRCRCPVEAAGCALQCQHTRIASACDQGRDCEDDSRCNLDTCVEHLCVHEPDPSLQGCCESDLDCDDGSTCTYEYCDLDASLCVRVAVSDAVGLCQKCCLADPECDDGDPLTLDRCQDHCCLNEPDPAADCKTSPAVCEDQNPCTEDSCDQDANHCLHASTPNCCKSDYECQVGLLTDGNACTTDICNPETNRCQFILMANECPSAAECNDGDPCTLDICLVGACARFPIPGCCQTQDACDDGNPCTVDNCLRSQPTDPAGTCQHALLLEAGCCDSAAHCDDGNGATKDLCLDFRCLNQ